MARVGKEVDTRTARELEVEREAKVAARKEAPNPVWFKPVMFGFMLLGLAWIVVYYITSSSLALPVPQLGQANIFVGFGLVLVGFLMTPWWK